MVSPELLGAELTVWSDLDTAGCAGAPIAHRLVEGMSPGHRVLVAGSHDLEITDRLRDAGAEVTLLLRSRPDAIRLAASGDITVQCGSLPMAEAPAGGYDLVAALGGVDRLCSTDGPELDWASAVERLLSLLSHDGELWLGMENLFSAHRLVQASSPTADGEAWSLLRERDPTRPASVTQLRAFLAARNLPATELYAGFGEPRRPSLLARVFDLAGGQSEWSRGAAGILAAMAAAATKSAVAGHPMLRDPSALVADAVQCGLIADMAAAWVVRARRRLLPSPTPVVLGTDGASQWRVSWQIIAGDRGWERTVVSGKPVTDGMLRRDPASLAGRVQPGRVLEEALVTGCIRRDLSAVRASLRHYRAWLAAQADADGRLPGRLVMATPRNVVVSDGQHAILDPSWSAGTGVPFPVAMARGLRQVAAVLVSHGHIHPWPADASLADLTLLMAAAAGHEIDQQVISVAAQLEASLPGAGEPARVESQQQLVDALAGAERRWRSAQAKLGWYEQMLATREAALRRTEVALRVLRSTPTYRVGRVVVAPLRWVRARVLRLRARVLRRRDQLRER